MSSNGNGKFRVYTIVERAGSPAFWLRLGNAFPHKDGKGFSMNLQAVPISGIVVVRQYEDDAEHAPSIDTQLHERVPEMAEA